MYKTLLVATLVIGLYCTAAAHPVYAGEALYENYRTPESPGKKGFVAHKNFKAAPFAEGDVSRFVFDNWTGPAIPVWTYVPSDVDLTNAPVVFVMHGVKRNPARYLLEWAPIAQSKGFVVVAPEFSNQDFRGAQRYNRGNVSKKRGERYLPIEESRWSFSAIEPLFDHIAQALGSTRTAYTLYGHSAGAQFVHRYLYYKPQARVHQYLIANAGWYTTPDPDTRYPFGLNASGITTDELKAALGKRVIILLGDKDVNTSSKYLNTSEGAMAQGGHRYNRGVNFHRIGSEQALAFGVPYNWRAKRVRDVGHSNAGMAKDAAAFIK